MALQLRRGLEADRLGITPALGEPIVTEQGKLYIGDGSTPGGFLINADRSGLANIVEDLSPQLGGNLDINGHSIVSTNNADINLTPNGSGLVILHGDLKIDVVGNITKTGELNISPTTFLSVGSNSTLVDGNLYVVRNSYSSTGTSGITLAQHHSSADAVNMNFYRTRGTGVAPTVVLSGDDLSDIAYFGHDGTSRVNGATFSAIVEGSPVTGHVPTKFQWQTNNGFGNNVRVEISSGGVFKTNNIQNLNGTDLNISGVGEVTATNVIIGNGAASPSAGTILTVNGTVTGSLPGIGAIISGGTITFGTIITAVNSATFTSTISTTTMTVSNVASGTITVGMALSGGSVTVGTYVVAFVSGINGGAGVYTLNQSATGTPTTGTSFTVSISQLVRSTTLTSGGNVNLAGNVKLLGQNSLRFADSDSSNWVAFQAPVNVPANITWTLPSTIGNNGDVLTVQSSGVLSWAAPTISNNAPALANSTGVAGQIAFDATHIYVCIATNQWVRANLATWP